MMIFLLNVVRFIHYCQIPIRYRILQALKRSVNPTENACLQFHPISCPMRHYLLDLYETIYIISLYCL